MLTHPGPPLAPHDLWSTWTLEPSLLIPLVTTVVVYGWGVRNVWRRAGTGHGIKVRRCLYFAGACMALIAALVSPLDALSGAMFSAHMVQHLLLILVAAPLLVMSDFSLALLWALPRRRARAIIHHLSHSQAILRVWHSVNTPVCAWLLFAIALWGWHAPALFEAALRAETIHAAEHLVLLVSATLFWWVLLKPAGPNHVHYGLAVLYLFTTALHSGVLGALMTFSVEPWYATYAARVVAWDLTPLEDQQMAGIYMWLPGGLVFTLLTIGYFAAWLSALEEHSGRSRQRDYLRTRQEPES